MIALSISTVVFPVLITIVVILLYRYLVGPYLLLLFYKRQGAAMFFYPELGSFPRCMRNAKKYGDFNLHYRCDNRFIAENFSSYVHLVLNDTDMIKEMLQKIDIYHKDTQLLGILAEYIKGSFLFDNGQVFKNKRRRFNSSFNFDFVKDFVPMIIEATQEKFTEWIEAKNLTNISLTDRMTPIAAEITGRFCFGSSFGKLTIRGIPMGTSIQYLTNNLMTEAVSPITLLMGTNFFKKGILSRHKDLYDYMNEAKNKCKQIIKKIETDPVLSKEKNLLTSLLATREKEKLEDRISDDEIVGEFMGFLATGVETPTFLMACTIYFLWKYPRIYEKVKEEVDREFADLSKVTTDSLQRMEYTTAFLKETMRLGGPNSIFVTRVAAEDDNLCGVKVKKGTLVNVALDLIFTNEKYYMNPREFIPERWIYSEDNIYKNEGAKKDSYAFIPFGAGPRNCIAQHLAILESKIVLALMVKTFKFTFPEDYKFILIQGGSFMPLYPLMTTLELRK